MDHRNLAELPTFAPKSNHLNAIIESPRGSHVKFDYNPDLDVFELSYILPAGFVFPFEFGFIPSTLGEDGDPLDVLVLMDAPTFVGCYLVARPIGVIEAEQTQDNKTFRNDRLIGIALGAHELGQVNSLADLNPETLGEIEQFFISYNLLRKRQFRPIARAESARATELVQAGMAAFNNRRKRSPK